mmetsp:Transcript_144775/g.463981  ORF Transcript_144775/g.463981 Transcript_144775/m.463981 type:complete len:223 (-) Transcript_144775:69-737(-)
MVVLELGSEHQTAKQQAVATKRVEDARVSILEAIQIGGADHVALCAASEVGLQPPGVGVEADLRSAARAKAGVGAPRRGGKVAFGRCGGGGGPALDDGDETSERPSGTDGHRSHCDCCGSSAGLCGDGRGGGRGAGARRMALLQLLQMLRMQQVLQRLLLLVQLLLLLLLVLHLLQLLQLLLPRHRLPSKVNLASARQRPTKNGSTGSAATARGLPEGGHHR